MYSIDFSKTAKSQLDKLSLPLKERIISTLERIKIRPFDYIKRKQGTPFFILRIGSYRAILDVKNEILLILVVEVGPRKNIYKN